MSSKAVRDAIDNYLVVNWITTPILQLDNVLDEAPLISIGPWLTLEYVSLDEEQMSLGAPGNNVYRESGVITFHLFIVSGTDIDAGLVNADILRDLFRGQVIDGVTIESIGAPNTQPGTVAISTSGNWSGLSVQLEYHYDILK